MDYTTASEIFDTLDEDNKPKEVYAHFGLAVFLAQVLEQQAISMIVISRQINGGIISQEEIDALWNEYDFGKRTFGRLLKEIKDLYQINNSDIAELDEILKLRNYIAHDYFRFNVELFNSDSGMKRMIKDFIDFQIKARKIDKQLRKYMKTYTDKAGVTPEMIQEIINKMKEEFENKTITEDYVTIVK